MEPALIAIEKYSSDAVCGRGRSAAKFIKANSILMLGGLATWRLIYPQ
jgi:hypothetical protein